MGTSGPQGAAAVATSTDASDNAPAAAAPAQPQRYMAKHPFVAGAMTGGIEILITFPLEFIKCQLQLKHHYKLNSFSTPIDCALYTIRTKGPLGLYKGISPWLVFAFPRSALRFSTYEYATQALQSDGRKIDPLYAMLAGTLAGAVEFATVGTPMQCIQIKMAHDAYSATPKFRGLLDAVAGIIKEEGLWRGMYAGVGPTVLKAGVNNCIRFATFNESKHLYLEYKGGDDSGASSLPGKEEDGPALNAAESMLLGAVSGGLSAVATHPIDTVKSNMQALGGGGYSSSWDCLVKIIKTQGVGGLYRGMMPRFVRVCLEIGLHFTLYERISRRLDTMW